MPSGAATYGQQAAENTGIIAAPSFVEGLMFARPNDVIPYSIGDLIANSTTPNLVVPIPLTLAAENGGSGVIRRARLKKNSLSIVNAQFRVHVFQSLPTITAGDNAAMACTESSHVGYIDVTMDKVFNDFAKGTGLPKDASGNICDLIFRCSSGLVKTVWCLVEARAAYAGAANEQITLTLEGFRG